MMMIKAFVLSSLLSTAAYAYPQDSRTYTNSQGDEVAAYAEDYDTATGSHKRCIEYIKEQDPESGDVFKEACFTVTITDQGTFFDCEVEFDGVQCQYCDRCVNDAGTTQMPGFDLDCNNVRPAVTTDACVTFDAQSVQHVLVENDFPDELFSFDVIASYVNQNSDNVTATDLNADNPSAALTAYSTISLLLGTAMVWGLH